MEGGQQQHRRGVGGGDDTSDGDYANIGDLGLTARTHEMVINPQTLMRARSSHSVAGIVPLYLELSPCVK